MGSLAVARFAAVVGRGGAVVGGSGRVYALAAPASAASASSAGSASSAASAAARTAPGATAARTAPTEAPGAAAATEAAGAAGAGDGAGDAAVAVSSAAAEAGCDDPQPLLPDWTLTAGSGGCPLPPPPHIPVLLDQVREAFRGLSLRTFIDGTLGAAGHTCAILEDHPELELLVGVDMDESALALAEQRLCSTFASSLRFIEHAHRQHGSICQVPHGAELRSRGSQWGSASLSFTAARPMPSQESRSVVKRGEGGEGEEVAGSRTCVCLVNANFREMGEVAQGAGLEPESVDGILLDIGVSSMQLDTAQRGFSFSKNGPLDMRMDSSSSLTAQEIVNHWTEQELGRVLRDLGEERHWRALARRIVQARAVQRIESTEHLAFVLAGSSARSKNLPRKRAGSRGSSRSGPHIHPATRAFQGLRIAVNGELDALDRAIPQAASLLRPRGRLAIVTFHSLEDRIVKHSFLKASGKASDVVTGWDAKWSKGIFKIVNAKPICASEEEIRANSRSRSAKLRILERLA